MAHLFTIPARNDLPFYQFKITLSNVIYTLQFRFNGRMNRWIVTIFDATGNLILAGIPCLIERNMTGQYRTLAIPDGVFFCTDDTGAQAQPTQYSFGLDHTLWYEDPA